VTHWFLSFLYRRPNEESWTPQDATTFGEHPLEYILRARQTYGAEGFEYRLMFFTPIPEDLYYRLNPPGDEVGATPRRIAG